MDGFDQIGKYIRQAANKADHSIKREVPPQISTERIRDIFDPDNPVEAVLTTPPAVKRVMVDFNFGKKLPSLACCGDCMCGITESYTSDSLVNGSIYVTQAYMPLSTTVYLDGARAALNVDYLESNPTTGQIAIITPSSAIVISYHYTVGNCTEFICVDERFECLGYTFVGGATTIFSDRFDRAGEIISDPTGSCGHYFHSTLFTKSEPGIFGGEASFAANTSAWVGGVNVTVGKSVETLLAINTDNMGIGGTGVSVVYETGGSAGEPSPVSFVFTKTDATTLRLRINGGITVFRLSDDPFSLENVDTITYSSVGNIDTSIPITGGRYWFRMAQIQDAWVMKAWPQFTPEPALAQNTATVAQSFAAVPAFSDEVSRELTQPAVVRVRFFGSGYEMIMVGTGQDNGEDFIIRAGSATGGGEGAYCAEVPDDLIRFGYNCGVNGASTYTAGPVASPTSFTVISFPTLFGPSNAGLGRVATINERVAGWGLQWGRPQALRLKGQIYALCAGLPDQTVTVQIKKYPTVTPLSMGGSNGVQGGEVLASFTLKTDATPADIDVFLDADPNAAFVQWGVHVPNINAWAASLPEHFGGPTSDNNVSLGINFYHLRVEAIQSIECNAGDPCHDCESGRCAETSDGFVEDTDTIPFGVGDSRRSTSTSDVYYEKGTSAQMDFSGGESITSFNGGATGSMYALYSSPLDCEWEGKQETTNEAYFEWMMPTLPAPTESGSLEFGGWNDGFNMDIIATSSAISGFSAGLSPSYNPSGFSTNTWYSVKMQTIGDDLYIKIWPSLSAEPASWSATGTMSGKLQLFYVGASASAGETGFTLRLRNIYAIKVV